ncbi:MAG: hypothetical protein JNK37_10375 [Verrucomicrobiales bacterium]|nr:hypothetical protein [Verrucomicrobiales bacterium]
MGLSLEASLRFNHPAILEPGEFRGCGISRAFLEDHEAAWRPHDIALYSILRAQAPNVPLSLPDIAFRYPSLGCERTLQRAFARLVARGFAQRIVIRREHEIVGTFVLSFDRPIPEEWRDPKHYFCWHVRPNGESMELRAPCDKGHLIDPTEWLGSNYFVVLDVPEPIEEPHVEGPLHLRLEEAREELELSGELTEEELTRLDEAVRWDHLKECLTQIDDTRVVGIEAPTAPSPVFESHSTPNPVGVLENFSLEGGEQTTPTPDTPTPLTPSQRLDALQSLTPVEEALVQKLRSPRFHHQATSSQDSSFEIPAVPEDLRREVWELARRANDSDEHRTVYELTLRRKLFPLMQAPPSHPRMSTWCHQWVTQSAAGLVMSLIVSDPGCWIATLSRRFVKRLQRGYITLQELQFAVLNVDFHPNRPEDEKLSNLLTFSKVEGKDHDGWKVYVDYLIQGGSRAFGDHVADQITRLEGHPQDDPHWEAVEQAWKLRHQFDAPGDMARRQLEQRFELPGGITSGGLSVFQIAGWALLQGRDGNVEALRRGLSDTGYHGGPSTREYIRQRLVKCSRAELIFWRLYEAELTPLLGDFPWAERRYLLRQLQARAEAHGIKRPVYPDQIQERNSLEALRRAVDPSHLDSVAMSTWADIERANAIGRQLGHRFTPTDGLPMGPASEVWMRETAPLDPDYDPSNYQ